eukprot:COSAG01_NODE_43493_length_429_cov_0.927273_2_plen_69_part_01
MCIYRIRVRRLVPIPLLPLDKQAKWKRAGQEDKDVKVMDPGGTPGGQAEIVYDDSNRFQRNKQDRRWVD